MRYYFLLLISAVAFSQQLQSVDFKTMNASLEINPIKRNVVGEVSYTFDVKQLIDTIRIDAQKMVFTNLKINGKEVKFKENKKQLLLFEGYKKGKNTLTFNYDAFPTQTMYFVNWDFTKSIDTPEEVNGQIWTQGQGKYTSHWLPSFDDVNEKVVFGLTIEFQKSFEVISNGELLKKESVGDNIKWSYQMTNPMSSYLVMLAIGHFKKQESRSSSGVPLVDYFEDTDSVLVEPTYRNSAKIFDFLEKEIGVPYPWKIYRQIPVHDFLYAGMENTTSTLFSRDFMVDKIGFSDRNFANVGAHELAHQWFGDLVTAQSGKDHWLQEGFATYYALLAERAVFGDDYFYEKLYTMSGQLMQAAKTDTIPILNEKASSLSFYQKGAWALHVLRESIGAEKFNKAVRNYLRKYAFQNVTTDDFLNEIKLVSDFDTVNFRMRWLEGTEIPIEEVQDLLLKNGFMQQYLSLQKQPLDLINDREKILNIMQSNVYYPIKELLVYQSVSLPFENKEWLLNAALITSELPVRQAVANSVSEIPESFRAPYETLLNDASYNTQEVALFKLWKQFADRREFYMEASKDWIGFQNQNLKILHLYLSFLTYSDTKKKMEVYLQLLQFTGTNFDSNVQQEALERLLQLEIHTEDVFRSLAYGTAHHRWQYVKFCKDSIRKLIEEPKNRALFIAIRSKLPIREKTHLQRLLDETKLGK
ncbi:MAG: M1 family metallopeptidase [Flavobacterium sp.]|nr:M1 family metallopeptidase [Flavobacterium sp.]